MGERIQDAGRRYQADVRTINRELLEKALHMRCLAYLSSAKAGLLTQALFEIDRSKKQLHGAYRRLSEEQVIIRRQQAELEAANAEMRAFSHSLSHDLRAPLRAISGFAAILREDKAALLDDAGRGHLARIIAAAERMDALIDAVLDLGRVARAPLAVGDVDLSGLAEAILQDLRAVEPARSVRWTVAPGLRGRADRHLVVSLLQNLLGNAWKFTRRRPDAAIEFGAAERDGSLEYVVRDNGVGLDVAAAGRLFAPFQRFHADADFEGIGIGLATVKRILDRHGGAIRVESVPGRGAAFYFTLGA